MITNNIQESYCSFEVSKLLQEKGFDCRTSVFYNHKKQLSRYFNPDIDWNDIETQGLLNSKITLTDTVCAPTHSLAIEWIRVNSGLWISILRSYGENGLFKYSIYHTDRFSNTESKYEFNSPQEATEAALLYTLKNLIK